MDYQIKKLDKSEVELTITVPAEKMAEYRKTACDSLSRDVKVKGFRPGHVPPKVLEEHVGEKTIMLHTQEIAIQKSYVDAVVKENLQVVARPKVKINSDDPFNYTATVAVMPEVEIKDYQGIKVKKDEVKVEKKDVDQVIDDMKKYSTNYKDVDRKAAKGDRAELNFEGFDGEKAVENTKSTNHPVILGEGSLIPGFEDNVIGMKVGEKKDFDITFPKDYGKKELQDKKLTFKIELVRLEEPITPELDEALIEKVTGKKQSIDEFKQMIETNVKAKKEQEAKQKQENDYIEQLLKKVKVEIPDSLIEEEIHYIIDEMKQNIEGKGMQFDKFLEQTNTTHEDLHKKYKDEADRRIKIRLALQHIIKAEKIEISDEELKKELETIKAMYPESEAQSIQAEFDKGELRAQLKNRLALEALFAKVLA